MQSYPFTSRVTYDGQGLPQYDRAVDSAFLRKVFAQYFSDGVFYNPTDALQVVAGTGMQVLVKPGVCHIQGAMGIETEVRMFPVPAAEAQPRIDTVVARLDLSLEHRNIDLYYVKGTAAAEPQAPALTRNTTIWELGTANIRVEPGTETVGDEIIADTRLDTGRCGTVAQTIGELDTEPYFQQLSAAIQAHDTAAKQQILLLQQAIDGIEQGSEVMLRTVYDPQSKGKPYIPAEEVQALIDDLKREIPQPGHWVFAPYRLTYDDEGVNAKRHPWVNFDDDLDKTVYAALYAAIGDTMSDGAADGMFNCKKLADRFPLVCGANFEPCEQGGEREHILTAAEMPKHTHATTIANDGSAWVAAWFNQNGTIHGKTYSGEALPYTASSGGDAPHNNMPPYLVQIVHIHT